MVSFCLLSCGQKDSVNELPGPPGAEVLKPGEGGPGTRNWTTKTISDGLLLHMFSGQDQVTGKCQNVCVQDVDLNMDGGGSTTLSVNGKVMNKPSGGSERTLPTHILVFDDQKK